MSWARVTTMADALRDLDDARALLATVRERVEAGTLPPTALHIAELGVRAAEAAVARARRKERS